MSSPTNNQQQQQQQQYHRQQRAHHQININPSPTQQQQTPPSPTNNNIPYSDHSPTQQQQHQHQQQQHRQNQLDQDVQAALHFSRARAGTLDLSHSPPNSSALKQPNEHPNNNLLWSNQDLLTGSATNENTQQPPSPTVLSPQALFIDLSAEQLHEQTNTDFPRLPRRPPSDNSFDSSHGAFIDHRPLIHSTSPAQQQQQQQQHPNSSSPSNLLISPSIDHHHYRQQQQQQRPRYPSEAHHHRAHPPTSSRLHSTPPNLPNHHHLLQDPQSANRPISDPSHSHRTLSLRDRLRRASPDPSAPIREPLPAAVGRNYSQGSIPTHKLTNQHRLFRPSSIHDSSSAASPRPSQAEEDVCFPRLPDPDRPILDPHHHHHHHHHPTIGDSLGHVGQSTTTAGMLPHFPFPFNFQALEEFAQAERETLETMKSRQMLAEEPMYRGPPISGGFPGSRVQHHPHNRMGRSLLEDQLGSPPDIEEEDEDPALIKDGVRRRKIGFLPASIHIDGGGSRTMSSGELGGEEDGGVGGAGRPMGARRLSENLRPMSTTKRKLALFEGTGLSGFSLGSQTEAGSAISGGPQQKENNPRGGLLMAAAKGRFPGIHPSSAPPSSAAHNHDSTRAPAGQVRWAAHHPAERPYRFSFYSNALPSTIHARSLSEIPGKGQTLEELFLGRTQQQQQQQSSSSVDIPGADTLTAEPPGPNIGHSSSSFTNSSSVPNPNDLGLLTDAQIAAAAGPNLRSSTIDPLATASPDNDESSKNAKPRSRSGVLLRSDEDAEASTWWLDVLSPTDQEMKVLSKVFGIHPLTTEDIQMEETREKIELFRNYYLVCFRSFDQDPYSPTYLEPLNIYIIVFREGTLSFHFRATPHPQNVRRRIKQLKDYINVTSDWISYALIDDITDAFGPLIQGIEYEVDSIDELVLILKDVEQSDMLRRIGTCRKKVMGLLRLMGNKADVVKGLAKRCNENWTVAPKSDIGLYLSDIQDHLVTMTQNLNHYEKILSRSHSNYLAQISIEMTDANNQINDVLSKLTALGSILVPMNLVTGLWGMNVHVPGQDITEGYAWFIAIVCGLVSFGVVGAWLTLRYFKFSNH
ncbi:CorA metal ion transporter [Puccinia graminis f. sp. tritici]|uniref:CorA metal ion transporter n=1 Tax=Puccinia graminis f. sp. tritici TaxID=56615 RepID=A0A5B0Q2M7_PUCGR|nr:CorA metal ion transporter [Puccinia graminis f. sp. tritici]KAA1124644.1 CorA metal ion transporter [Puccinia graminis f. sp. tritici]